MFKIWIRAIVGIMIFLGYFLLYVVRYNLSVHIVDMAHVNHREKHNYTHNVTIARSIYHKNHKGRTGNRVNLITYWDDCKMAQLFTAYHIGYCVCFPIFHNIGDRLGPTWLVGIAGITSGILNCLTPPATYRNFWLLFLVRIMKGFCAGAMQPSMVQLLRHWVPPVERNHFMWAYCGITTGTFSTFLICATVQYYSRWPMGFYMTGACQVTWAVVWVLVIADYPAKHPCISKDELAYLKNTIGTMFTIQLTNSQAPWRLILRSVSFWALCILNFGYSWMIISLCLHGPMYYAAVVEYSIYSASVLTAVPFLLRLMLGTVVIQTFHWYLHSTEMKRIRNIRKYCIVVSHVIPGLLVCSTWMIPHVFPGPILLTIAVALTAAGMDLTLTLCYELSPNYANSINTVIKIIGNIPGIIVPLSVGEVTHMYRNSTYIWKHIWCFHALVLLLCGVIFLIWGDVNIQPWNSVRQYRPHRARATVKPSVMSNIIEVDEEEISTDGSRVLQGVDIAVPAATMYDDPLIDDLENSYVQQWTDW